MIYLEISVKRKKDNIFSCFDEEDIFEDIAENEEKNIEALEEKFKNDTFPSTVIGHVKQYNGHSEMSF